MIHLRKLSWFFILVIFFSVFTAIHFQLKNKVILKSFSDLELVEAGKNMARCTDAFKMEVFHLNRLAGDWAVWDDTYRFTKDRNQRFIDSNLHMDTLEENSNINLVFILSPTGKRIWGKAYDSRKKGFITVDAFADPVLHRFRSLMDEDDPGLEKSGILVTNQGPMLLTVRHILTSKGTGPSAGIFIMGRFITEDLHQALMDQTHVTFTMKTITPGNLNRNEENFVKRLETLAAVTEVENDRVMNAYGVVPGIFGEPALFLHAFLPRDIMEKGRTAARYVSFSIMVTAFFILFFFLFVIKMRTLDEQRRTARVEALVDQRTMELKLANMETEKARIEAVEASKAKSEFLANMSHEIRTPLNGVIGMAEIALTTIENEKQREVFEIISREALSLLGIINNILDFSKIEARKVELESIPFDLKLLVGDIGKSVMYLAERKGLTCIMDLTPGLPRFVKGDPGRIRQILTNLTGNALKFTQDGGVVIHCEQERTEGATSLIRFSVTDTGIGIERHKQEKIFDSFTQVDGSTTRKYGGTGLGISISKHLSELMGGQMGVDSELGMGSTFWFTCPLIRQNASVVRPVQPTIDHLNVLVAGGRENEPLIHVSLLNGLGCRTENRLTGEDAVNRLKQPDSSGYFDLIVIDYLLSDMDGFTLAEQIRALDTATSVPIILTTRIGDIGDGKRCEDLGIQCYLSTPLDPAILRKAISVVMGTVSHEKKETYKGLVTRHTLAEIFKNDTRVLLVEDYPTNRQVAVNILRMSGFDVDVAENGKEAVSAFQESTYDLILMDVQMPVMDGYEATRMIRDLEALKEGQPDFIKTPIVAMTANALTGDREKCLEAGMDDFITKPVTRSVLLETVFKWASPCSGTINRCVYEDVDEETDDVDETPQDADAPLNYAKALSEFMGDKVVLMDTLDYFLNHVRSQIETITHAISENMGFTVAQEAHKIKGGSANLTMNVLSKAAADLEFMGKTGHLDDAKAHLNLITREVDKLETFLSKMR